MTRKLALAACLALTLTGCGFPGTDPFGYGDGKRIKAAVEQLFGELERADYAAAASHWCAAEPPASPPTADELKAGFAAYPRPWRVKPVTAQHTPGGTGFVNVTLTDGAGAAHPYNVDFTMAGGGVTVCDVDTGTVHIEVDV
ncbi:hypothetical protein Daura_34525 [Dactylosporangium aurantiacum]|uniref:Lipoprotein n=1 Tax=Dactylosporangium aurantiacum TaxID=35754 RepID=A0A9Q9I9C9_9ACTN|nr:hypothetical protein [Dactylosporangium aurantiacum]MDG6107876.1 hypothetical protein [Dactylosporangium aurantiacum]UWZ51812.1 hypothetical protein Daura_34525 [Dactylosporangium aurantiacum]